MGKLTENNDYHVTIQNICPTDRAAHDKKVTYFDSSKIVRLYGDRLKHVKRHTAKYLYSCFIFYFQLFQIIVIKKNYNCKCLQIFNKKKLLYYYLFITTLNKSIHTYS